jgi:hypothetical protein
MNTTPTPPQGYKLVKGIDIKDLLPIDGIKCWYEHSQDWLFSVYSRNSTMTEADTQNIYAIPSSPESITDEAKTIVAGDRASDYGDANESFSRIAKLWSAYTGATISPWDVAQMMILLKVSRAKTSRKRDTLVDIVGYAECASKLE